MPWHSYGHYNFANPTNQIDEICQRVDILGYALVPNFVTASKARDLVDSLFQISEKLEHDLGASYYSSNEVSQIRHPLTYDLNFLKIFSEDEFFINLITAMFSKSKSFVHINQQNAVINTKTVENSQSTWHRDYPYVNLPLPEGIGYSFFLSLTEFTKENGATKILPFSHKMELIPEKNWVERFILDIEMDVGSLLIFDSQIFHCAGINSTKFPRIGLNTMFSNPVLRQQVDLSRSVDLGRTVIQADLLNQTEKQWMGFSSKSYLDQKEIIENKR